MLRLLRVHSGNTTIQDFSLLTLRCVAGLAFMIHGFGKIQAPFTWMGPDTAIPGIFVALAALSEFGGGLAWILGLLTPLASLGILSTMAVAVYFHLVLAGDPFVPTTLQASYELPAMFICIALILIAFGPGRFSLDARIFQSSDTK